jgi:hypothetical protein
MPKGTSSLQVHITPSGRSARDSLCGRCPEKLNKLTLDEMLRVEALLLGRRSYEWFAARWPSRSGELADRLNGVPKCVVSLTLEAPPGTTRRCSTATW